MCKAQYRTLLSLLGYSYSKHQTGASWTSFKITLKTGYIVICSKIQKQSELKFVSPMKTDEASANEILLQLSLTITFHNEQLQEMLAIGQFHLNYFICSTIWSRELNGFALRFD